MSREEIEKKLFEILDEGNLVEINENGNYIMNAEIDSIQLISAIVEIEERFNIDIADEYLVTDFLSDFNHVTDVIGELITLN